MLPRKDQIAKVAFLTDGPLLEAFYIHPVSSQQSIICFRLALVRFPAIFFRQLFLVVSLLPGCVQSISFFFSFCVHLLRLMFSNPFRHFHICFIFCLTESLHSSPCSYFESLLIPAFLMAHVSAPCLCHTPYQRLKKLAEPSH